MSIGVLVSGGVDSSVALHYAREQSGHSAIRAFYLKIWLEDELSFLGGCPWEEDLKYVEAVCKKLDVPLEVIPMQQEYLERIIAYTLDQLKRGLTPSPDVFCNRHIKLGAFVEKAGNTFDTVVTGHYAQVKLDSDGAPHLFKSKDIVKDQTYFLSLLKPEQLAKLQCPLGDKTKREVRAIAQQLDLPTQDRKDSQGLCFLGKIKYDEFVKFHLGEKIGNIFDEKSGKKLGTHRGYWFYTIGQRKGLGLGGGPWFVTRKCIDSNTLFVSHEELIDSKNIHSFILDGENWFSGDRPPISAADSSAPELLTTKVRHGAREYQCFISLDSDSQAGKLKVTIPEGDRGIAEGQISVIYSGNECLGGGQIVPYYN